MNAGLLQYQHEYKDPINAIEFAQHSMSFAPTTALTVHTVPFEEEKPQRRWELQPSDQENRQSFQDFGMVEQYAERVEPVPLDVVPGVRA